MKALTINKAFWLLLIICTLTVLPFIGLTDYHTKGEPRESIVSYSMIESGNWILPTNNGGEMAYKPPFFHWSIAAVSMLNGGQVTEMTSRLPSAIALISMIVFGFLFFAKRKGVQMALLTSFIAFTSFELHRAGANCRVDMVLTALTVGALYDLYRWYEKGLKGMPWVAILCMSLGTLTKGPVGSIIPCLVMGIFLLLRGVNFFKALGLLSGAGVLSLILPACWYVLAYQQGGEEFIALVMEENVGRMTNTMSYESCVNPWHYNLVTLVGGYVPWTLLAVLSLFSLTYRKFKIEPMAWCTRFSAWIKKLDVLDLFVFVSIVVIFVFYCIPQSKRSVYLMPMYPFIAYFLAKYLFYLVKKQSKVIKVYGGILAVLCFLLFACFLAVKFGCIPESIFQGRRAQTNIDFLRAIRNISGFGSYFLISIPTALGIYWWKYSRIHALNNRFLFFIVALILGLYLALDSVYQPTVLNAKSIRPLVMEIDRIAPESEGVLYEFIEEGICAVGNPVHYFEVNYYLNNRVQSFYKDRPDQGFLLIGTHDADKFIPEFEKEGYQFEQLYESPKRISGQIAKLYKFIKTPLSNCSDPATE